MRFWFWCLIRLVPPLLHFQSKTWFYNEQWNHRQNGVAIGIIQISKKVVPDARMPGVWREGARPKSDLADVLMSGVVPNIPYLNDGPSVFLLCLKGTLAMGGQEWFKRIRSFPESSQGCVSLFQLKTCWAGSWQHSSAHVSLPHVSLLSGFHPGADRDCPQRPESRSSPEDSSRPAALYGRYSAQIPSVSLMGF